MDKNFHCIYRLHVISSVVERSNHTCVLEDPSTSVGMTFFLGRGVTI